MLSEAESLKTIVIKIIIFVGIFHSVQHMWVCTMINFQQFPLYTSLIQACTII